MQCDGFIYGTRLNGAKGNIHISYKVKRKVKCTVVQALRLCTGCTVRRGSRGIGKGKVHRCTDTEALYRLYGP